MCVCVRACCLERLLDSSVSMDSSPALFRVDELRAALRVYLLLGCKAHGVPAFSAAWWVNMTEMWGGALTAFSNFKSNENSGAGADGAERC